MPLRTRPDESRRAADCDRGAAQRVRKAVRAARLEAYVLRAQPLVRDREVLQEWRAYSTSHRRGGPHGWWRRRAARYAVRAGRYDTGVRVAGAPEAGPASGPRQRPSSLTRGVSWLPSSRPGEIQEMQKSGRNIRSGMTEPL